MSAPASERIATAFVVLKGGLIVPLEALQLAWALEDRGATFEDRTAIRQWRGHLKAIASYRVPEVVE